MRRIEPTISDFRFPVDRSALRRRPVERKVDPPLMLTAVACLLALAGLGLAFLLVDSWSDLSAAASAAELGTDWPYTMVALSAACLCSGLLLMSGARFGWYLALIVFTNGFLAAVNGIAVAQAEGLPLSFVDGTTMSWYVQYGVRAFLTLVLLFYFLAPTVRKIYSVALWRGLACVAAYVAAEVAVSFLI